MKNLETAVFNEIMRLKRAAQEFPELKGEFVNMGFGVFSLWMNLAGYKVYDENQEIAEMRDYCTRF